MATGGYYIEADTRAFIEALRGTEGGIKDLKAAYADMASWLKQDVGMFVPVYGGQHSRAKAESRSHDGASHPPPGNLKRTLEGGARQTGPWVSAGGAAARYTNLQEWGGASVWRRGGARWSPTQKRGRSTGAFTVSHKASTAAHVVYTKPRMRYGYFIWNAGYRNRRRLGRSFYEAISDVAAKHGIAIDVPANPDLDIKPQARSAA